VPTLPLVKVKLTRIGDYVIALPNWCTVHVFNMANDDEGELFAGDETICEWVIPQVELFDHPLGPPPLESYDGEWEGRALVR
jgi:hypothetical protein